MSEDEGSPPEPPPTMSLLERGLRVFGDVRAGESTTVLLMFANIFTILVGYYIIKTVREPLIINTGGAEMKKTPVVLSGTKPTEDSYWGSMRRDQKDRWAL